MTNKIVIAIDKDGRIETLLKDSVFDTRVFSDTRKIERLSEVIPTDDGQQFFIRWLKGPRSLKCLCMLTRPANQLAQEPGFKGAADLGYEVTEEGQTMYFDTYEEAVAHEVATVNELRLQGHSFV
jgi:hypothetical protein